VGIVRVAGQEGGRPASQGHVVAAGGQRLEQAKPSTDELERRDQPVTAEDLRILERADQILASEAQWNRRDTRECGRTDKTWSLFCALQKACIEVLGVYEHRRVALQEVRFAVEEMVDVTKLGGHRLMGFNNLETTTFSDIKRVLETARARVADRLPKQRKYPVEYPRLRTPPHPSK
jgi:hypothetical protein